MADDFRLDNDKHVEELIHFLLQGGTVQEIYNMSDSDMEVMFVAASRYLRQQQWRQAADCFLFLTFLNPYRYRYWLGLGEAEKKQEHYEQALQAYQMAALYRKEDPRSYFHAASCYIVLDKLERAHKYLMLAKEHCRDKDEFRSLFEVCGELAEDIAIKLEETGS